MAFAPGTDCSRLFCLANLSGDHNFTANRFSVLTIAIGGYGGIELIACTSSETKKAPQSVPWAMFATLLSVSAIYAGMCASLAVASGYVLSADKTMSVVPHTLIPATIPAVTELLAGSVWGRVATLGVVSSIVGCGIGGLLACARVGYSMAITGLFPKQFAELDERSRVPTYAVKFQAAGICVLAIGANLLSRTGLFPDAYSFLAETFCFIYLVVLVLYGVTLITLRYTDAHLHRPFRIGGSGNGLAWLAAITAVCCFGCVALFCAKLTYQISGVMLFLTGIPVYAYYKLRQPPALISSDFSSRQTTPQRRS